jgi:hypothetical protein
MRRTAFALLTLSFLVVSLNACSKPTQKTQPPVAASPAQIPTGETGPFVVMGHLEHRDRVVTIKSGAEGLVYSVHDRQGKILFENLTAAQLKTQSPEIHSFIEAATAGQAGLTVPQIPMKLNDSRTPSTNR